MTPRCASRRRRLVRCEGAEAGGETDDERRRPTNVAALAASTVSRWGVALMVARIWPVAYSEVIDQDAEHADGHLGEEQPAEAERGGVEAEALAGRERVPAVDLGDANEQSRSRSASPTVVSEGPQRLSGPSAASSIPLGAARTPDRGRCGRTPGDGEVMVVAVMPQLLPARWPGGRRRGIRRRRRVSSKNASSRDAEWGTARRG